MAPGETQQLLVRAKYADGRVRDVTWLAQFFSNDETTISVKPNGLIKALRAGQGSVRVHFLCSHAKMVQSRMMVLRAHMIFRAHIQITLGC